MPADQESQRPWPRHVRDTHILRDCAATPAAVGFAIHSLLNGTRRLIAAASRLENLPYTILGGLMLLSLASRLVLMLS